MTFEEEIERAVAKLQAMAALGVEPVYSLHYRCEECDEEWDSEWSCACDDECPGCGISYSPYDWECDTDADD